MSITSRVSAGTARHSLAVTGAGDVDHAQIVLLDHPVHMHVDEVHPRRRSPVAEQHAFDVGGFENGFVFHELFLNKVVVSA